MPTYHVAVDGRTYELTSAQPMEQHEFEAFAEQVHAGVPAPVNAAAVQSRLQQRYHIPANVTGSALQEAIAEARQRGVIPPPSSPEVAQRLRNAAGPELVTDGTAAGEVIGGTPEQQSDLLCRTAKQLLSRQIASGERTDWLHHPFKALDNTAGLVANEWLPTFGKSRLEQVIGMYRDELPYGQAVQSISGFGGFWPAITGQNTYRQELAQKGPLGAVQRFGMQTLTPTNAAIAAASFGVTGLLGQASKVLRNIGLSTLEPASEVANPYLIAALRARWGGEAIKRALGLGFGGSAIYGAGQTALNDRYRREDPSGYMTSVALQALLGGAGVASGLSGGGAFLRSYPRESWLRPVTEGGDLAPVHGGPYDTMDANWIPDRTGEVGPAAPAPIGLSAAGARVAGLLPPAPRGFAAAVAGPHTAPAMLPSDVGSTARGILASPAGAGYAGPYAELSAPEAPRGLVGPAEQPAGLLPQGPVPGYAPDTVASARQLLQSLDGAPNMAEGRAGAAYRYPGSPARGYGDIGSNGAWRDPWQIVRDNTIPLALAERAATGVKAKFPAGSLTQYSPPESFGRGGGIAPNVGSFYPTAIKPVGQPDSNAVAPAVDTSTPGDVASPPLANAPRAFQVGDWVRSAKGALRLVVGDADPRYLSIKNIATQRVTKGSAGTLTAAPFEATHDLTAPGETRTPVALVPGVGTKAKPFVSDVSGNARAVLREWLEPHIEPTGAFGVGGAQAAATAAGGPSLSAGAANSTGDSAVSGSYVDQAGPGVDARTGSAPSLGSIAVADRVGQATPLANAPRAFQVGDWVRTAKGAHRLVVGDADPRYLSIKNIATQRVTKASAGTLTVAPFEATHDLTVPGETRTPVILVHGAGTKAKPFVSDVSGNARAVLREWLEPHIEPTGAFGVGGAQAVAMAAGAPSLSTGAANSTGDSAAPGTYVGQAGPGVDAQTGSAPSLGSTSVVENNAQAPPPGDVVGGKPAFWELDRVLTNDKKPKKYVVLNADNPDAIEICGVNSGRIRTVTADEIKSDSRELGAGHYHHVISRKILSVLEEHETLADKILRDDGRLLLPAVNDDAHRGYWGWHERLDREVMAWLKEHVRASPEEFMAWLSARYSAKDLAWRFPDRPDWGVRNLLRCLPR